MTKSLASLASEFAPYAYSRYLNVARRRQRKRVQQLLGVLRPPVTLGEELFLELSRRTFPSSAPYHYDRFSSTARAAGRVQRLIELLPELRRPWKILEVSCGDGLVGAVLALGGHDVTLTDIRDWRNEGARSLAFVEWDVCAAPHFADNEFDLVLAYNATEHWESPSLAVENLLRICKPGARILFDFGPIFNSPWGLHAWNIKFPYPQFLFDPVYIAAKTRQSGVNDLGASVNALQPTNGWSLADYRKLWQESGAETLYVSEDCDFRFLDLIEEFADCFSGRSLQLDELTVNSIEIILAKPAVQSK